MSPEHSAAPWPGAEAERRLRRVLEVAPVGLFTDVDGTISAIAPTPDAAILLPGVRELLTKATRRFALVAAVSGRSAPDARRLVGVPDMLYIGNHGMESIAPGANEPVVIPTAAPYVPAVNAALAAVEQRLAGRFPGLLVERKGPTGSVHVRQTADPEAAERAVDDVLREVALPAGLRLTRGKMVIEVRPPVDVDKGQALTAQIRAHALAGALYLGDDRTDVDAFHALRRLEETGECRGVGVAVLQDESPPDLARAADVSLAGVARAPELLRRLLRQ
ncbi:MAG: trehalose-phosphatase [Ktedonobacterales bacterium]